MKDVNRNVNINDVKNYWENNPLCAVAIPFELGSKEYFTYYNSLREANESKAFSYELHEYKNFAGRKVLDIGCGNGYIISHYAAEGAEAYGVDLTNTAVELTKKRFGYLGLSGNIQCANAEMLPFDDNVFDCVCSMGVLHHTPNTQKALDEVYRVLKPGGRLILMFYNKNSLHYRLFFQARKLKSGKSIQQLTNEVDGIGNPLGKVYSKKEMKNMLSKFRDLTFSFGYVTGNQNSFVTKIIPRFVLTSLENKFGWFMYIKGYKPNCN